MSARHAKTIFHSHTNSRPTSFQHSLFRSSLLCLCAYIYTKIRDHTPSAFDKIYLYSLCVFRVYTFKCAHVIAPHFPNTQLNGKRMMVDVDIEVHFMWLLCSCLCKFLFLFTRSPFIWSVSLFDFNYLVFRALHYEITIVHQTLTALRHLNE